MDMSTNNGVYLSKSISVCLPDHLFNLLLKSLKKNKPEKYTKIVLRPCICVKPVLRSISEEKVQTVCDLTDSEEKLQEELHGNESALLVWKSYTCESDMTNNSTLQVTESLSDISLHSTLVDMFPDSHPQDIHMYNNSQDYVIPYYMRNVRRSSYNKSLVSETKEEEDVTANNLLHSELNPIEKESILPEKPLLKTKSVLTQTSPALESVYVQTDEESGKLFEVFTQAITVQTDLKTQNDSSTQTVTQFNSLSTQTMIDSKSVSTQTIYELRPAAAETVSTQTEDGAVFFFENHSQETEIKKISDTEIMAKVTGVVSKSSEVSSESYSTELSSDLEDTLKDLGHPVSSKRVFLSLNNIDKPPETMVELKRDKDFDSVFMKDSADKVIVGILTDVEEKIVVEPVSPQESRIYKSEFFRELENTVPVTVTDPSKKTEINYSQPISVNTEFKIEEYHPVSKRDFEKKPKEIPVEVKKTSSEIKKTHDSSKPDVQIGLEKITTHKDMKKPFHKSHNNGKEAKRKLLPAETKRITKPVIRSKLVDTSIPRTPAFKSRVLNTERGKEKYSIKPVVTKSVIKNVAKPKQQIISRPSKITNVYQKSSKPLIAQGKTTPVKTKIGNITEFKAESKLIGNKSYQNHAAKHYATVTVLSSSKHKVTMKKNSQSSASHPLRMAADTTVMQESYQPVNFKTKPVLHKPDKFHKKRDQPLDDTTIHKMSYVPHSIKEKKEQTRTSKGTYKTDREPMDDRTIYKESFIPPGKFESVDCDDVCCCSQLNPSE